MQCHKIIKNILIKYIIFSCRYGEKRRGSVSALEISGVQLLSATFNQLKKGNQQLLILITVFIGKKAPQY